MASRKPKRKDASMSVESLSVRIADLERAHQAQFERAELLEGECREHRPIVRSVKEARRERDEALARVPALEADLANERKLVRRLEEQVSQLQQDLARESERADASERAAHEALSGFMAKA
jgi:hypothetical protein